jgi:hypothetical protein
VKSLALVAALAFGTLVTPPSASAGLGAVERPDAPCLPQTPEGRGTPNFALPTPARAAGLRGQLQISGSPASAGRNWH